MSSWSLEMESTTTWRIWLGVAAGLSFGILDVASMMIADLPARTLSVAFASRFAIGFLIPQVSLPLPPWLRGVVVALLITIPEAIMMGSYPPTLMRAVFGGLLIGAVAGWQERRRQHVLEHGLM